MWMHWRQDVKDHNQTVTKAKKKKKSEMSWQLRDVYTWPSNCFRVEIYAKNIQYSLTNICFMVAQCSQFHIVTMTTLLMHSHHSLRFFFYIFILSSSSHVCNALAFNRKWRTKKKNPTKWIISVGYMLPIWIQKHSFYDRNQMKRKSMAMTTLNWNQERKKKRIETETFATCKRD